MQEKSIHFSRLPLFSERADFKLERPGAARLLIKLPVSSRHRGWRHQQIGIIQRLLAPELLASLAHPRRVDAGVDNQMRHVDVLRAQLARHRLRDRAETELGAGKRRISAAAAQGSGGASE